MLIRRSSIAAKSKMLLFVLSIVYVVCFSQSGFSQKPEKHDDILQYNGNTIEFAPEKPASTDTITDPETGKKHIATSTYADPPIKLNDKKIYEGLLDEKVSKPKIKTNDKSLCNYVMRNMETDFSKLENGEYFFVVCNVVVNSKGKIVYFENQGIYKVGGGADETKWKKEIDKKINGIVSSSAIDFKPATLNGRPVNYLISNTVGYTNGKTTFKVKDHKVSWYRIEEQ